MFSGFLIPFISIALAELGDKTQLIILLLAAKTKHHVLLASGIMAAFFIVDGLAILLGSWITAVIPLSWLKLVAGLLFVFFGVLTLRSENGCGCHEKEVTMKSPFWSGFMLILVSEMGDKTQIAAGLFATKYPPLTVLAGTMAALALLTFFAIWLGSLISKKIDPKLLSKSAGVLFILIGIVILLQK